MVKFVDAENTMNEKIRTIDLPLELNKIVTLKLESRKFICWNLGSKSWSHVYINNWSEELD